MDAALAMQLKLKLEESDKKVSDWQLRAMIHGARKGKEQLLDDENTDHDAVSVVVPGRGRSLIGGSMKAELTRDVVRQTVLDGFFPLTALDDKPQTFRRGLATMGLPFAQDAAVSKHLSAFLHAHAGDEGLKLPQKVLFNGGVTRSQQVRDRVLELLAGWAEQLSQTCLLYTSPSPRD